MSNDNHREQKPDNLSNIDRILGWRRKNRYYHNDIAKLVAFLVPPTAMVLQLGCGTGELLGKIRARKKVGIDESSKMVDEAKRLNPQADFFVGGIGVLPEDAKFDYIVLSDFIGSLPDVEKSFNELQRHLEDDGRVVLTFHSYLWEPIFIFLERLGLKDRPPLQNWLSMADVINLLYLSGFEKIKSGRRMLFPRNVPFVAWLFNSVLARLPIINRLCITNYVVARKFPKQRGNLSLSIVVPARNEKGNIEELVKRVPEFSGGSEIIFIEGHSKDGTFEEIERVAEKYGKKRKIKFARQEGVGKGDAVRKGFGMSEGQILAILDADMTVAPEDIPKFYSAIVSGRGDFINGCRLVYPMEKQAMRFLNSLANKFFAVAFSWILSQPIKDTLCGTKVILKSDYEKISANRAYFGDFDPFGDFDLILGAAKLNLKIVDLPIRYRERTYGETQIQRFRHGWLLLKMCLFAARKLKLSE